MLVLASGCGSSTGSSSSTPARSNGVSGFGASNAVWNRTHTPDTTFAAGAVYNADSSLPEVNGHTGAHYTAVQRDNGHIDGYEYHFADASISAVKGDVLRTQLPSDARIVWFARKDTCAEMLVRSQKLAQALGEMPIGDKTGTVLIYFNSGANDDTYNPRSVNEATFFLMLLKPRSQAPGC
jgi:hypothetical protein